jgi:hypothetical protein
VIALAPQTFDVSGPTVIDRARLEDPEERTRRVNRSATLDGGATVADMGYSDADRTFRVTVGRVTREESAAVAYLLENYGTLVVSTEVGIFLAAPEGMSSRGGTLTFNLLVTEKLA